MTRPLDTLVTNAGYSLTVAIVRIEIAATVPWALRRQGERLR